MNLRKLKWILLVIGVLLLTTMTAFLALFIIEDLKRQDGIITDLKQDAGDAIRELRHRLNAGAASERSAEASLISDEVVSTGLIDLRVLRYAMLGIPKCPFLNPGAIAADGDGLLFAHCSGRFFRLQPDAAPSVQDTGFSLSLHWQEMVAFAPQGATQEDTSVTVIDLLHLRDGKTAVSYTRWDPDQKCFAFTVSVLDMNAERPVPEPLFQAQPCIEPDMRSEEIFAGHQAGGRLAQISDRTLLVSIGDFRFDGVSSGADFVQDPKTDLGKIIAIDLKNGEYRHFSTGHRNPQGLVHLQDGRIVSTEHGPQGGDEVNIIRDGSNYGWPLETLGVQYGGDNWPLAKERGDHSQHQKPMFAYMPSIGISQLIETRGFAPEWDGDLLVTSLTGHALHRLRLEGDRVLYSEPIFLNRRLRDIVQLPDGRIAILTDDDELILIAANREGKFRAVLAQSSDAARQVMTRCLECHGLDATNTSTGRIPLAGLVGRNVAAWPGFEYSTSLDAIGGTWTRELLDEFLADPGRFAPGTPMASKAISDARIRSEVVTLIGNLSR